MNSPRISIKYSPNTITGAFGGLAISFRDGAWITSGLSLDQWEYRDDPVSVEQVRARLKDLESDLAQGIEAIHQYLGKLPVPAQGEPLFEEAI